MSFAAQITTMQEPGQLPVSPCLIVLQAFKSLSPVTLCAPPTGLSSSLWDLAEGQHMLVVLPLQNADLESPTHASVMHMLCVGLLNQYNGTKL